MKYVQVFFFFDWTVEEFIDFRVERCDPLFFLAIREAYPISTPGENDVEVCAYHGSS